MACYPYHLVNVFAESFFAGNPLCVFTDARGMDASTMQALAFQFNLAETVFVIPQADGRLQTRVFTPTLEMPFAGHPAIGCAHVMRACVDPACDTVTLSFAAGDVVLEASGDAWSFSPPGLATLKHRPSIYDATATAAMLGLANEDITETPVWIDSGNEQLVVILNSPDALRRATLDPLRFGVWEASVIGRRVMYMVAFLPDQFDDTGRQRIAARYCSIRADGRIGEDFGTGSACANLGAWWQLTHAGQTLRAVIEQGDALGRPCRLLLDVTANGGVTVGGRAIALGAGQIDVPD